MSAEALRPAAAAPRTLAGRIRRPGPLAITSLLYVLVVTGVMIWKQISVSPDYLLVVFVPVAVLSGRLVRFLKDWIPFVVIFLAWEAMRGFAPKLGIAPHVSDMASIETWLFGGHEPSAVLQSFFSGTPGRVMAYGATIVYFCHFVIPLLTGLLLWLVNRTQFLRYSTALLAMSLAAIAFFVVVPTAPPWLAEQQGYLSGITKLIDTTLGSSVSPYYHSLNPNQVAAWPSLHAAFPLVAFLFLRPVYPRASWLMLGWSAIVWFSVVFLGEHYVIDVIGGIAFALGAWWLTMRVAVPRVRSLQQAEVATGIAKPETAPVPEREEAPALA